MKIVHGRNFPRQPTDRNLWGQLTVAVLDHLDFGESAMMVLMIWSKRKKRVPLKESLFQLSEKSMVSRKDGVDDTRQQQCDLIGEVVIAKEMQIYLPDADLQGTAVDQREGDIFSKVIPKACLEQRSTLKGRR